MAVISDHVDIDASPEKVWQVLADVQHLPSYSPSTVAVRKAPKKLTAEGDTFVQVVKLVGKQWTSTWTVVEFSPCTLLRTEGKVAPGVRLHLTQRLTQQADDTTRLQLKIQYVVPGGSLGRLVSKAGLTKRAKAETAKIMAGIRDAAQAA